VFLQEPFPRPVLTATAQFHYNRGLTFWSPAAL